MEKLKQEKWAETERHPVRGFVVYLSNPVNESTLISDSNTQIHKHPPRPRPSLCWCLSPGRGQNIFTSFPPLLSLSLSLSLSVSDSQSLLGYSIFPAYSLFGTRQRGKKKEREEFWS
ncbi:hypothetical protein ACOSQ3_008703 [Xanthoceras sorbifolium]